MLFKNAGAAAGATLEHTHSQLIVTPIVPISVLEEMNGSLEFFTYRGRCIYCDMIHQELASEAHRSGYAQFRQPGSFREPISVRNVDPAQEPQRSFENIQKTEVDELGTVLKTILLKLETALDKPAYNYIIHTSPFDSQSLPHYHWHIEVIPRLTRVAGFEWGTGFYINPVPPEQAAAFLRETEVEFAAARRRTQKGVRTHFRSKLPLTSILPAQDLKWVLTPFCVHPLRVGFSGRSPVK